MYQSRSSNSICRQATEPVELPIEVVLPETTPAPENVGTPIESSYTVVNKLDTLSVHTRNNFELFKSMYSAVQSISVAQNNLTDLLVELLKKQETTHNMLHELATPKPAIPATNPLPEMKRSFSSQLLKPKKKP